MIGLVMMPVQLNLACREASSMPNKDRRRLEIFHGWSIASTML